MNKKRLRKKLKQKQQEISNIKRELAMATITVNHYEKIGSDNLWSINDFLNNLAENVEKMSNTSGLVDGSITIDIIPIQKNNGPQIKGYKIFVGGEQEP